MWTSRLEALEAELQTAKEEVEGLRAPRTETSMQQPDSDSDEASGNMEESITLFKYSMRGINTWVCL